MAISPKNPIPLCNPPLSLSSTKYNSLKSMKSSKPSLTEQSSTANLFTHKSIIITNNKPTSEPKSKDSKTSPPTKHQNISINPKLSAKSTMTPLRMKNSKCSSTNSTCVIRASIWPKTTSHQSSIKTWWKYQKAWTLLESKETGQILE